MYYKMQTISKRIKTNVTKNSLRGVRGRIDGHRILFEFDEQIHRIIRLHKKVRRSIWV
jgi:mRNA-degrading endonuclease RelE of RelBE toxin-antitoxin system